MDSATNLTNDEYYLDNHLKQVVERYDNESDIEIYGLGVGLSLSPYYQHCTAIDLSESLSKLGISANPANDRPRTEKINFSGKFIIKSMLIWCISNSYRLEF